VSNLSAVICVIALGAFALHCSDDGDAPATGTGGASLGTGGASGGAATNGDASSGGAQTATGGQSAGTFSEVESILQRSCSTCHNGKGAALDRVNLSNEGGTAALYLRLTSPIPDTVTACQGTTLVDTQALTKSLLPQIIETNLTEPDCRIPRMPYQCSDGGLPRDCLSVAEIATIRNWVASGAPGP
jgi:hypothetical protein